jgi:hypothetical protein
MKTQDIAVKGQSQINVTLSDDTQALDEVVVIGYGTVAKKDLTGSVSSVSAKQIAAILNTYLQVNPIEKLTLRTQFGANAHYRRSDSFVPKFNMDPLEKQDLNEITRRNQEWFDWNWTMQGRAEMEESMTEHRKWSGEKGEM